MGKCTICGRGANYAVNGKVQLLCFECSKPFSQLTGSSLLSIDYSNPDWLRFVFDSGTRIDVPLRPNASCVFIHNRIN